MRGPQTATSAIKNQVITRLVTKQASYFLLILAIIAYVIIKDITNAIVSIKGITPLVENPTRVQSPFYPAGIKRLSPVRL